MYTNIHEVAERNVEMTKNKENTHKLWVIQERLTKPLYDMNSRSYRNNFNRQQSFLKIVKK